MPVLMRMIREGVGRVPGCLVSPVIRSTVGVYDPDTRGRWIKRLPQAYRALAEGLGKQLDVLEPLRDQAECSLLEEAKTHPTVRIISTVPGMGRIRSAQVVAVVATPHRFRTRQQFWSYCGLGIVTRSSADWVYVNGQKERREVRQTRRLTRKRNPLLKQVFKGAATTVITQLADHPLHEDYWLDTSVCLGTASTLPVCGFVQREWLAPSRLRWHPWRRR